MLKFLLKLVKFFIKDFVIQFDDVYLFYGDVKVLNGISFIVEVGKIIVIVGVFGVGKFMFFNVLICFVDLIKGKV